MGPGVEAGAAGAAARARGGKATLPEATGLAAPEGEVVALEALEAAGGWDLGRVGSSWTREGQDPRRGRRP
jgi:hypothetical protein